MSFFSTVPEKCSTVPEAKISTVKRKKEFKGEEDDGHLVIEPINKRMHIVVDPAVLRCIQCSGSLLPPLRQCLSGHTACDRCCNKTKNKCRACSRALSRSGCQALEKLIESVNIPCAHSSFGCNKTLPYTNRAHEEVCAYAPCCCPFGGCSVRCAAELMADHLIREHQLVPKKPIYSLYFISTFVQGQAPVALRGTNNVLFLLLNESRAEASIDLFVVCVSPISAEPCFSYELKTKSKGNMMGIEDSVGYLQQRSSVKTFLKVPQEFFDSGALPLEITIKDMKEKQYGYFPTVDLE